MDSNDRKIIELLKMNSRITSSEISRQIHLSVPAVSERIRKLEEGGIIQRFTVKLNREKRGILLERWLEQGSFCCFPWVASFQPSSFWG